MNRTMDKSASAMQRACKVLVGGVNSPVRAYAAVGGNPPFIARACGARVVDLDGNEYLDYVGSWGPAILGHAPQEVLTAINKVLRGGTSFGAPTLHEVRLAEAVVSAFASIQKVRLTSSGTEAVMTAVRLARGATGRAKIVKFIGGYHGHADPLLVQAGSGATTLGEPSSPGVPEGATAETLLLDYNDLPAVEAAFESHGPDIAAVLVEPVAGNMGVIPPDDGFLPGLRELCSNHGTLLVADEVMTGFRLDRGGAQERFAFHADLTTLGKIIGGGLPVGAVGGSAELMDHLAPLGPIYQAGTLSGNPAAMAAGEATLQALLEDGVYARLESTSASLEAGLREAAQTVGLDGKICIQRVGSMLSVFFTPGPVRNYTQATASNPAAFTAFFHAMLAAGVYLPPSPYESWFVSLAHDANDIRATVRAAESAFQQAAEHMDS
jgi:glutamate-1-semialdehyde 2,1-aminomutase